MCNRRLLEIAGEIKNRDMSHFWELYEAFGGLIHHFEIKLGCDDAGQELTVFLLELMYSIDTNKFLPDDTEQLNRYIAASIRNKYIALSKKRHRHMLELCEHYDSAYCVEEREGSLTLRDGMKQLNERQREAITSKYIYGYSDAEIAEKLGITRQAVNRLERRGLEILKEYLSIK